jgi:site-specific DNA-methyltransferase (adenine-specific)
MNDSVTKNLEYWDNSAGRFPSQAFITTETAEILDKQSGVLSSGGGIKLTGKGSNNDVKFQSNTIQGNKWEQSQGGASKILHKCDFETADFDLFVYEPKVSASERNAGCEFMEKTDVNNASVGGSLKGITNAKEKVTNNHPTLKPISLNYQITKLFKTPNPQTVLVPFSGAGSELIGLFKAGFENIKGCELNPEFAEIAKARVKHHCEDLFNQNVLK